MSTIKNLANVTLETSEAEIVVAAHHDAVEVESLSFFNSSESASVIVKYFVKLRNAASRPIGRFELGPQENGIDDTVRTLGPGDAIRALASVGGIVTANGNGRTTL